MRFYWKLSHLNEHIVVHILRETATDTNHHRRRLSAAVVRAICLINMMKMIFVFIAQTTTDRTKVWNGRKKDYIRLLYSCDNNDTVSQNVRTRCIRQKKRVRKNLNRCMKSLRVHAVLCFGYNFNENYHCHVRNVRYCHCNVINWICLTKMNVYIYIFSGVCSTMTLSSI